MHRFLFLILPLMAVVWPAHGQLKLLEQQINFGPAYVNQSFYGGQSGLVGFHFNGAMISHKWLLEACGISGIGKTDKASQAYNRELRKTIGSVPFYSFEASVGRFVSQRGDTSHSTAWSLHLGVQSQSGYLKPAPEYRYAYTEDSLVKTVAFRSNMNILIGTRYQIRNLRPNGGYSNHVLLLQTYVGIPTETKSYTYNGSVYEQFYGPKFRGIPIGGAVQYRWYQPFNKNWGWFVGYQFNVQPYGKLPEPQAVEFTNTGGTRFLTTHQFSIGIGTIEVFDRKKGN